MRTTLVIDDKTFKKASELTGIKEKTSLVRQGLEALILRESSRRLASARLAQCSIYNKDKALLSAI